MEEERLLIKQIKKSKRQGNMYNLLKGVSITLGLLSGFYCGVTFVDLIQGNYYYGDVKANIFTAVLLLIISLLSKLAAVPYCELKGYLSKLEIDDLTDELDKVRKNI